MKKVVYLFGMGVLFVINHAALADTLSALDDFSGVYDCKGQDAHEGAYTGVVTMKKQAAHSVEGYTSYEFTLSVPDYGTYQGHAAAQGRFAAVHFALPIVDGLYGGKDQDFGTGIAEFTKVQGKWQFKKFYYEPLYKGGNTGQEICIQR